MAMDDDQARPPRPEGEAGDERESAWHFEPDSLQVPAGRKSAGGASPNGSPGEAASDATAEAPIPLRVRARIEGEADGTPASGIAGSDDVARPRMTFDEMLATPAESGSIVDAMREWADKPPDELEPRRGRRLLGEVEIQQANPRLLREDVPAAGSGAQGSQGPERGGRFSRIFGRRKREEAAPSNEAAPAPGTIEPPAWGDRLTFKEPHSPERPLREAALPITGEQAETVAGEPPTEVEPAWLSRLRAQTAPVAEPPASPALSSPEVLRDDPHEGDRDDAWSEFDVPDVLDHYRDHSTLASDATDNGAAEIADSSLLGQSLHSQLASIEELAGGSEAGAQPREAAATTGEWNPAPLTDEQADERILRWPGKRLPPIPEEGDAAAPHDWNSSGLFDGYDEPTAAEAAPDPGAPPADSAAQTGETRPATFAEALAQLRDREPNDDPDDDPDDDPHDDPWKAVADFERPELGDFEPSSAPSTASTSSMLPAVEEHLALGDEHRWDDPPDLPPEPAPLEAMRGRDVFGGETAFGGPQRGVLSRWGDRMREESAGEEWPGLPASEARAVEADEPKVEQGEEAADESAPEPPRRLHPMQDHEQFATSQRLPGGFDAILGRDADNLLREIDSERIDSARRSPTLRVRPGIPADDPLWRADDEDHERRYLRGDFDDPHDTQPEADGAVALPLFGGGLAGEHPEDAEAATAKRSAGKAWVREVVETGLLALLVFLAVRASFQNFKVDGHSMDPTLENGQLIIVNKLIYQEINVEKLSNFLPFINTGNSSTRALFHGPRRGDIVVLVDPRHSNQDLIKRVIGLPGEAVEISDGKVYINDQLLIEPYITTQWHDTKAKQTIPAGEYFVMGDNRDNSLDSRSIGPVAKQLIIGKAMLSYWPGDRFGFAPNEEGTLSKDTAPKLSTTRIGDK